MAKALKETKRMVRKSELDSLHITQQVEAEFSPRPNIKKLNPAKVSTSGPSMVPVQLKTGQKSGCSPDFVGARALNPHRAKATKNASKKMAISTTVM